MKYLKLIRSIIASLAIVLMVIVFLNFSWIIDNSFIDFFLGLQFLPSLLHFVQAASFISIGFLLFTVLALFFGRIYCSTLCPLGILQDVLIRISKRFNKKRKYRYKKPSSPLRHILLILSIVTLLVGSSSLVLLIDPYSNFGRISTHFIQPVYILINNLVAEILNGLNIYSVYHIDLKVFHLSSFLVGLLALLTLIIMTFNRGRLFCNSICPVGTLLGWFSKYSLFKLKFNEDTCISCGKCERMCKAESIDFKSMKIDFDRCVTCFNCVDICPTNAISYVKNNAKQTKSTDELKRDHLKTIAVGAVALSGLSFKEGEPSQSSYQSKHKAQSAHPIMPPGAINVDHFKQNCTACHLCVSACPSNVLQPSFAQYGIDGLMLPQLNYMVNFCQYECNTCSDICPTGAIRFLPIDLKKQTQIGKVKFIEDNCVVKVNGNNCGACAEHCPTTAVKMVPFKGHPGLNIPQVDTTICIGCGACEYPCPHARTKQFMLKAIPFIKLQKSRLQLTPNKKLKWKKNFLSSSAKMLIGMIPIREKPKRNLRNGSD